MKKIVLIFIGVIFVTGALMAKRYKYRAQSPTLPTGNRCRARAATQPTY
jgi:hypothetical protein